MGLAGDLQVGAEGQQEAGSEASRRGHMEFWRSAEVSDSVGNTDRTAQGALLRDESTQQKYLLSSSLQCAAIQFRIPSTPEFPVS